MANSIRRACVIVAVSLTATVTLAGMYFLYHFDSLHPPYTMSTSGVSIEPPSITSALHSKTRQAQLQDYVKNPCDVGKLKQWNRRVITELLPPIARNCSLLLRHDKAEISRVKKSLGSWKSSDTFEHWKEVMSNCSYVIDEFTNNFYLSPEELDFPIAFSIIIHTNPEQIVRLLKAIYRPHNLYCIHPDASQGSELAKIFRRLSSCLENVFVASRLHNVRYDRGSTITDAQLSCTSDFMAFSGHKWKYAINICGTELPAMTNREMVKSLKKLNGVSAIQAAEMDPATKVNRLKWKRLLNEKTGQVYKSNIPLGPPPHNIAMYKSLTYIAASRAFAEFVLTSKISKDLYNYLDNAKAPEELFYSSLYRHPGTPGGYQADIIIPTIDKCIWLWNTRNREEQLAMCSGDIVHNICILNVGELRYIRNTLAHSKVFFFNKYSIERDHVVMDCMEERLLQQNLLEYRQDCEKTNGT